MTGPGDDDRTGGWWQGSWTMTEQGNDDGQGDDDSAWEQ